MANPRARTAAAAAAAAAFSGFFILYHFSNNERYNSSNPYSYNNINHFLFQFLQDCRDLPFCPLYRYSFLILYMPILHSFNQKRRHTKVLLQYSSSGFYCIFAEMLLFEFIILSVSPFFCGRTSRKIIITATIAAAAVPIPKAPPENNVAN